MIVWISISAEVQDYSQHPIPTELLLGTISAMLYHQKLLFQTL